MNSSRNDSGTDNGPLNTMLEKFTDPSLDELFINGSRCLQLNFKNESSSEPSIFSDELSCLDWLYNFADAQNVRLDARFPASGGVLSGGGYRWHAVIPPMSPHGALFCLRKARLGDLALDDFSLSEGVFSQVLNHLEQGLPLIICVRTATGKTSLLCALLKHLYLNHRVVILEAIDEIPLLSQRWVKLTAVPPSVEYGGISLHKALKESLRLSPDRYVVGELRENELRTFFSAIETGHYGGLTTLHASNERQVLRRLKDLSGIDYDFNSSIGSLGLLFMKSSGGLGLARFTLAKDC